MIDPTAFIHPSAHVDASTIGPGCKVWQFASITRGTVLGEGCSVAPFALLDGPVFGARCVISMHVAIGPGFWIWDRVFIGPNVTFANDMWPRVDKIGWDVELLRAGHWAVIVKNDASIGANAVVLPGVTIGEGAIVAAGAVCDRSVPDRHLFRRDGTIVEINQAWTKRRMRRAEA